MRADLIRNYAAALDDARQRGVTAQVQQLETILQDSIATINIDAKLLSNMAKGQNYLSYYNAFALGLRRIAEREYHAHRLAVDAKIHTGYESEIVNAALSPDGRGLTNYGEITLVLEEETIEDRASLMRENAFDFYERYQLGRRNAKEESGWRSTWVNRSQLGVAHLCPSITPATAGHDLVSHVLFCGSTRPEDRYIEIHIYGEVSWQSLSKVVLEKPLTTSDGQDDWKFGRIKLEHRGIRVFDQVNP
jgi:hypothetical protein